MYQAVCMPPVYTDHKIGSYLFPLVRIKLPPSVRKQLYVDETKLEMEEQNKYEQTLDQKKNPNAVSPASNP